jgi:hypothetical protein
MRTPAGRKRSKSHHKMRHSYFLLFLAMAAICSATWASERSRSHCANGEHTFFSCHLKGSNTVASICGDPQRTWAQFRLGPIERARVKYPLQRAGSLDAFEGVNNQHGAVYLVEVTFRAGERKYAVSSYRGEASLPRAEVAWSEGAKVSTHACDPARLSDQLPQFTHLIPTLRK